MDGIRELDRTRLQKFIQGMNSPLKGTALLTLLRDFRNQLPASDGTQNAAA
jgi:hypothetical protein